MNTLQAVLLKFGRAAAAPGMPSTWLVLSVVTRAVTDEPQAEIMAGPTARTGGEVIIPSPKAVLTKNRIKGETMISFLLK
jgi:hypothetical protein